MPFGQLRYNITDMQLSSRLQDRRSGDGIPVGGQISRSRPDSSWDPPNLLQNVYRVSFPWAKRPGRGVNNPPASNTKVKEGVQVGCTPLWAFNGLF
jgi:hypothetical protein